MKRAIKVLIKLLARMFAKVYSYSISERLTISTDILYTLWISGSFKRAGNNLMVCKPMYLKGGNYIAVGDNTGFGKRCRLEAWDCYENENFNPQIIIGSSVSIGHDCHIGAVNSIIIGDNVLIGSKVFISDHSHGFFSLEQLKIAPIRRKLHSKGVVKIKDNVWIGEAVTILPGITIGFNCIIGANTVVTRSVPDNCIVVGNPGKVIKMIV